MSNEKNESMPTNQELAVSIQRVEETLSEVLVLLYHVVQQHQEVTQSIQQGSLPRPLPPSPGGPIFRRDIHEV
jgi:hypothetical protein